MVTFRNNNGRRNSYRRNERIFKSNGERNKFNNNFTNSENFLRKAPGRNNHNASKLIEKYSNLAREALSNGDKILSENYFQLADHFTRILSDQEKFKKTKNFSINELKNNQPINDNKKDEISVDENLNKTDKSQSDAV